MGLDQYAFRVYNKAVIDDFDFERSDYFKLHDEFFYWRKNNALHDWMQKLYAEKSGIDDPGAFNCKPMRLYDADLIRLHDDIKAEALEPTAGFFFGELNYDKDCMEQDLRFVAEARKILLDGDAVYYDSWW